MNMADNAVVGGVNNNLPESEGVAGAGPVSSAGSGDGGAAVKRNTGGQQEKRSGGRENGPEGGRQTTRAVSAAINRAVDRYKKLLDAQEKNNAEVEQLLVRAGLPADIQEAVSALSKDAEALRRLKDQREETVERDMYLLGQADAEGYIADRDVERQIRLLEEKPLRLRSLRDRACYEALAAHRQLAEQQSQYAALGLDYGELSQDGAFRTFMEMLNPQLPPAQKYMLYLKYHPAQNPDVTPPQGVESPAAETQPDFFTPDQVKQMGRREVEKNLKKITASMAQWGKRRR